MKNLVLLLLSICCPLLSLAQTGALRGRVVDESTRGPLEGVTILGGDAGGMTSDRNGEFTLSCTDSVHLRLSFLGYRTLQRTLACGDAGRVVIALASDVQELGTVEVTATSTTTTSPLEQPRAIVKLEETALERSTGLYLEDAINTNVPGVTMQRRTQSGGQQLNIRGYGSGIGPRGVSSNFDGQGVKVYLNGIPVTDAEGLTVLDDIDFGSVSTAEVLKGPAGTLYGLAIAGVLNLETERAPREVTSVGQEVLVGNYGLLRTTTRLRIGGKTSSVLVNYGHQEFGGFMPHTESRKDFANLLGDFRLNDKQTVTTYLGYADSYDARNGELSIAQYESLDYFGNPRYIKNNAHSAVRTFRAGIGHHYRFGAHLSNTTTLFGSAQNLDNSSAGGWTDKQPANYGLRSVFETRFALGGETQLSGITGVEAQKMNAQTIGYGMGPDSSHLEGYNIITSLRSDQATINSTVSYFTQWTLDLPRRFSLTAGVGVSSMHLRLEDRLWGLSNNHPGNARLPVYDRKYTNLLSPSLAINKQLGAVASVYAAYSSGYKAPVSGNILISTTGELNTGLTPEHGVQLEVGTKGSFLAGRLAYTLAAFQTKFKDKFTTITVQNPENTATLYSYIVNGGRLNNQGLEVAASYDAVRAGTGFMTEVRPFANLTYSDFTYEEYRFESVGKNAANGDSTVVQDYSGKAVAGVAPVVFNLGVDVATRAGVYGNAYYNYRGRMPFTSDGVNETDPYGLLNAKVGVRKRFGHLSLDLYAGAYNLTGAQYYQMVFVNQLPDAYIPGPNEANFFGGINLSYTL
ncbi:TonB-dependent receptor [Lewinella sp. IMCC34183]|uniref:TonB-dependent receptor n=1 Tax=Lewinella sp. IMCC34183 TaxID=2248762 RepID=UPI000E241E18|nr:TonB-dependent receptor [Lewinella sp. IMCC34183]